MTTTSPGGGGPGDLPPPAGPPPAPGTPAAGSLPSRRRLTRTPDGKIGGVCAGLGHYLDVDPVLVRIAFIAFTLLAGVGLLIYIAAWLLVPKGGAEDMAPAAGAVPPSRTTIIGVIGLALGAALVIDGNPFGRHIDGLASILLIAGGIALLVQRDHPPAMHAGPAGPPSGGPGFGGPTGPAGPGFRPPPSEPGPSRPAEFGGPAFGGSTGPAGAPGSTTGAPPAGAPAPTVPASPAEPATASTYAGPGQPGAVASLDVGGRSVSSLGPGARVGSPVLETTWGPVAAPHGPSSTGPAGQSAGGDALPPVGGWSAPVSGPPPHGAPATPAPSRRAPVTTLGLAFLAIAGGSAIAADRLGWIDLTWPAVFAGGLVIVGAALLVAAFVDRAPGLVTVGLVLTLGLLVANAAEPWADGGIGSRVERPGTVAELADHYRLGMGDLELDLRSLRLPPGTDRTVEVRVGVGEALVLVPRDATVVLRGHVGIGELSSPDGDTVNGADRELLDVTPGADGGRLRIELHIGIGEGSVERG